MRRISRKTIDAINTNVRISDVFEWLGETVSANRRMAFCPFCADKEFLSGFPVLSGRIFLTSTEDRFVPCCFQI